MHAAADKQLRTPTSSGPLAAEVHAPELVGAYRITF
jgi:hypothetical protein